MKLTKQQMGFVLSCLLWIRQIGWSFSVCSEKSKEEMGPVLKYWPEVCDFKIDDLAPKKKSKHEVFDKVEVEKVKRRRRAVRV